MDTGKINGYLEAMGYLNQGPDFGCTHEFVQIRRFNTAEESLEQYFHNYKYNPDSEKKKWEDLAWLPKLESVTDWQAEIQRISHYWFLTMPFSPKCLSDLQSKNLVAAFLGLFNEELDGRKLSVWKVKTDPPVFYANLWDDYLFEVDNSYFLLHFGVVD
jgi:hypothetical protein